MWFIWIKHSDLSEWVEIQHCVMSLIHNLIAFQRASFSFVWTLPVVPHTAVFLSLLIQPQKSLKPSEGFAQARHLSEQPRGLQRSSERRRDCICPEVSESQRGRHDSLSEKWDRGGFAGRRRTVRDALVSAEQMRTRGGRWGKRFEPR